MALKAALLAWIACLLCALWTITAHAQSSSGGAQTYSSFFQTARAADMALTSTMSTELLPANSTGQVPPTAWICNEGPDIAYVAFGVQGLTVTQANGFPIPPARCVALNATAATYLAGIADSTTATLQISLGYGHP